MVRQAEDMATAASVNSFPFRRGAALSAYSNAELLLFVIRLSSI
jgi:hypothetical protein